MHDMRLMLTIFGASLYNHVADGHSLLHAHLRHSITRKLHGLVGATCNINQSQILYLGLSEDDRQHLQQVVDNHGVKFRSTSKWQYHTKHTLQDLRSVGKSV